MNQTTAPRIVEHRDILKGFDAQIARLDREEDELFEKLERGQTRDEAQVVYDALTKVKGQKEKLVTLKKEEMETFERQAAQDKGRGLQPAARSDDDHRPRQEIAVRPLPTDVIDLSFDKEPEVPVKQEASTPSGGSVPGSTTSPGGRRQQRSFTRGTDSPVESLTASLNDEPFAPIRFPTIRFRRYPPVGPSHPTLILRPIANGAIELRCPYCETNMDKTGSKLLDGVNGFTLHLRYNHKDLLAPGETYTHKRAFELCSYRAISQNIVNAIRSGDLRAHVVEKVYQKLRS